MSEEVIGIPVEVECDAMFGPYVAADQAPGLVYGLVGREGLVYSRGFGRRDDAGEIPDLDTVFPIASMSKSFGACAALIARDRGQISLSDPVDEWVPEFKLSASSTESDRVPTVGMLLSMSGGLTEDNAWVDPFINRPRAQLLAAIGRGVRLSRPPGSAFEYSNLGYELGCLAVSRAVSRPIEELIAEEILGPLGMTSTFADKSVPGGVRRATGYSLDLDGNWVPFPPQKSDAFTAAGGLVSTVRDLSRWITWLGAAFRPAQDDTEIVLSRASRRELQTVHTPFRPVVTVGSTGAIETEIGGYALGLELQEDLHRGTFVHHSGGLPGFLLHMRWHPDSGQGVVVLTNSHRGDPRAIAVQALARVLARDQAPAGTVSLWPQTRRMCLKADALIRQWSDELAGEIFAANVDFDRPLSERRKEIAALIEQIGPLLPARVTPEVVAANSPADVTWSIPGERGELICMVHLTALEPPEIQELVVRAFEHSQPRSARAIDVSKDRAGWGEAFITAQTNVRVRF